MEIVRGPLQGVYQIVRFNWPFFVQALVGIIALFALSLVLDGALQVVVVLIVISIVLAVTVSLFVSFYVYDLSSLYSLDWLHSLKVRQGERIVNIHAGFDETSALLQRKFPHSSLAVCDFYEPEKHTEPSIRRARKACAAHPGTIPVLTTNLPLAEGSVDKVFLIFSAHEIRNVEERQQFFQELSRILSKEGVIILVEHLRDIPNLLAYNLGFLHFHSWSSWARSFQNAHLVLKQKRKITPFVTVAFLAKHDTAY